MSSDGHGARGGGRSINSSTAIRVEPRLKSFVDSVYITNSDIKEGGWVRPAYQRLGWCPASLGLAEERRRLASPTRIVVRWRWPYGFV